MITVFENRVFVLNTAQMSYGIALNESGVPLNGDGTTAIIELETVDPK